MFRKFRTHAHHFFLKRKLKKNQHPRKTFNYWNAAKIIVLVDITIPQNLSVARKLVQSLKTQNKKTDILAYIEKERPGEAISVDYFSGKDINLFYFPKQAKALELMNTKYDLLINLCTEECLPLEYISALSKASFRTGRYLPDKTYCYDLMIETSGNKSAEYLAGQTEHFLKMIK